MPPKCDSQATENKGKWPSDHRGPETGEEIWQFPGQTFTGSRMAFSPRVHNRVSRLQVPDGLFPCHPQQAPPERRLLLPSFVVARRLGTKRLPPSPSGVWRALGYQSSRRENPQGKRGVSRQQTPASHKQERPVPHSGGVGPGDRGILLPPHEARALPEHKRNFVRSRPQGGSVWEGTYHH